MKHYDSDIWWRIDTPEIIHIKLAENGSAAAYLTVYLTGAPGQATGFVRVRSEAAAEVERVTILDEALEATRGMQSGRMAEAVAVLAEERAKIGTARGVA